MLGTIKCDICLLIFRTPAERNDHILKHFQKKPCTICEQNIILIGDTWYSAHNHPGNADYDILDIVKSELNTDDTEYDIGSVVLPDFVEVNKADAVNFHSETDLSFLNATYYESNSLDGTFTTFTDPSCSNENVFENKTMDIIDSHQNEINDFEGESLEQIDCDSIQTTESNSGDNQFPSNDDKHNEAIASHVSESPSKDQSIEIAGTNQLQETKVRGVCNVCGKQFACRTGLKYHMNLHLKIKPYECGLCHSRFADKRNLVKHIKTIDHSNYTPRAAKSKVIKATESVAEIDGKKIAGTCKVCDKVFLCRTGLKYHMNLHLNVKPYVCEICNASYSDKRNLNQHKKTHEPFADDIGVNDYIEIRSSDQTKLTNEQLKSLMCPICERKFLEKRHLRSHMNVHNGTSYMCKFCRKTFRDVNNYKRHRLTVHKNMTVNENDDCTEIKIRDDDNINKSTSNTVNAVDWVCEYCNEDFEFEIRMAKHIIKEHNENKPEHACNICNEKLSTPANLLAHMRGHMESTQHKCTFDGCGQGFAYKSSLGVHLDKHNRFNGPIERKTQDQILELTKYHAAVELDGKSMPQTDPLACRICEKEFPARTNLLSHIQNVHTNNEWMKCPVVECDKIFKTVPGIFWHVQTTHPDAIKTCEMCNKKFYSTEKLDDHRQKRHNLVTFDCTLCEKKFTEKSRLRAHLMQHEKEVPCNLCDKKFSSAKVMMEHRERHGKKLIIRCKYEGCNQTFESRRESSIHSNQHPNDGKKKFICSCCGKGISTRSSLRAHMNAHNGERPYKCKYEECGKTFTKDSSLRRHNMIHTGEKPYHCDIEACTATYRDSIDLKRHKFSVHKIYTKKHICSICSKVFPERKLLTKHTNVVHGKIDIAPNLLNN